MEGQTRAVHDVERKKPEAQSIGDQSRRERHLEFWMGATYEAINILLDICDRLVPQLITDLEITAGIKNIRRLTEQVREAMEPHVSNYGEKKEYGQGIATSLRDSLFPESQKGTSAYESLVALLGLHMYLSYLEGHMTALTPASQALWDKGFIEAVTFSRTQISRQQAWISEHIKVMSPQTLLVPGKPLEKGSLSLDSF